MIGGRVDVGVRGKSARSRRGRRRVDAGRYAGRTLSRRAVRRERVELVLAGDGVSITRIEIGAVARPVDRGPHEVVAESDIDGKTAGRFELILSEYAINPAAASHLEDVSISGLTGNTKQQGRPGVSSLALLCPEARGLRGPERR